MSWILEFTNEEYSRMLYMGPILFDADEKLTKIYIGKLGKIHVYIPNIFSHRIEMAFYIGRKTVLDIVFYRLMQPHGVEFVSGFDRTDHNALMQFKKAVAPITDKIYAAWGGESPPFAEVELDDDEYIADIDFRKDVKHVNRLCLSRGIPIPLDYLKFIRRKLKLDAKVFPEPTIDLVLPQAIAKISTTRGAGKTALERAVKNKDLFDPAALSHVFEMSGLTNKKNRGKVIALLRKNPMKRNEMKDVVEKLSGVKVSSRAKKKDIEQVITYYRYYIDKSGIEKDCGEGRHRGPSGRCRKDCPDGRRSKKSGRCGTRAPKSEKYMDRK